MSVFPSWPWTNYNNYNLDWIIKKVSSIEEHIEELVIDATGDILDDTLTDPDKAAQAKAAGDAIRANASNITNLGSQITELNNRYLDTVSDVTNLTRRVSSAENDISGLGDADDALSDRITALEGTVNAVKDYVFSIYEYTGANDPFYICTMEDSPNGINSLLSDLNGRIPVNVKAIINYGGMTGSRVSNLTTVRVSGEIHGVEFDAGDFHCRFLDSNTMGTAYFNKVYISVNRTTGTASLVKGDCMTLKQFTPQISITHTDSGATYIPIYIDHTNEQSYIKLWYLDQVDDVQQLNSLYVQVNVDNSAQVN